MTEKEKVVFFVDYASINRVAREKRYRLDYGDLLHYIGEDRFLVDAYCYVPINPSNEHRLDGEIEALWRSGYVVTIKQGMIFPATRGVQKYIKFCWDTASGPSIRSLNAS